MEQVSRKWEAENATAVAVRGGGVIPRMKGEDALNATGGMGLMVVGRLSRRMNRFKENG